MTSIYQGIEIIVDVARIRVKGIMDIHLNGKKSVDHSENVSGL